MKRVALFVSFLVLVSSVDADDEKLLGTWKSVESDEGGMYRIITIRDDRTCSIKYEEKGDLSFFFVHGTYKILSNKILSATFTKVSIHHPILNKGISVETDNIEDMKNPFKFDGDKLVLGKLTFKKIEKKKQ